MATVTEAFARINLLYRAARAPDGDGDAIVSHLGKLVADRGMTLTELSERVGVSVVNLSGQDD